MQFFFATPNVYIVSIRISSRSSSAWPRAVFFLPELLAALAVDVRQHSRCVVLRRIIRHLLHSTAKAHSVAHKITAVIEIHAHR